MIIVQLTAKTIASASFFSTLSTRVVDCRPRQRLWRTTSIPRTNAARVKSTVLFRGCDECQYVIPANELANAAEKVATSLDTPVRRRSGSKAFLPPRMITKISASRALRREKGYTADHCKPVEANASFDCGEETPAEFAFRRY